MKAHDLMAEATRTALPVSGAQTELSPLEESAIHV